MFQIKLQNHFLLGGDKKIREKHIFETSLLLVVAIRTLLEAELPCITTWMIYFHYIICYNIYYVLLLFSWEYTH